MRPLKILILRFSAIGDIVLTTPVVRVLKQQLPSGTEVHYFTKPQNKGLVAHNPYIDKVWLLEEDLAAQIGILKAEKFDYVIDLHKNLRTTYIKWRLGVPSYSYFKAVVERWMLIKFGVDKLQGMHIVDRYFEAVKPLGVKNDGKGLDYYIPEKDQLPEDWLPEAYRGGFFVYAIGGQHFTKRMPAHKMAGLCAGMGKPVVLLGGKEDIPAAEEVVAQTASLNPAALVFNACGKLNLNQSASLALQAKVVYAHDTGMMHIAAALKKPVVAIWGSTDPKLGFYPYQTAHSNLLVPGLSCRPCTKMGRSSCPKGHFKCMNDIDVGNVALPQ